MLFGTPNEFSWNITSSVRCKHRSYISWTTAGNNYTENGEGNATFTSIIKRHNNNFKHEFIFKHILEECAYIQGMALKSKQQFKT